MANEQPKDDEKSLIPLAPVVQNCMTVDMEEWFHILDTDVVPTLEEWSGLESRIEANAEKLLELFAAHGVKATFFWLGWAAERHKKLVRTCAQLGHEIASHGYAHVLAYQVGPAAFEKDARRAKSVLEDISGCEVSGYRAAGFGITEASLWAFDVLTSVGYSYESSVFPGRRCHGGLPGAPLDPYWVATRNGPLLELPLTMVNALGRRLALFGGGHLRISPRWLIKWGTRRVAARQRPLIIYVHPRDIDVRQPRLPLPVFRSFKCYVNLHTTFEKLRWLCGNCKFETAGKMAAAYAARLARQRFDPSAFDTAVRHKTASTLSGAETHPFKNQKGDLYGHGMP